MGAVVRLTVITPIGPGHEQHAPECAASVLTAWGFSRGPFTRLTHELIIDTAGDMGRSAARNGAIQGSDADWLFLLDADDLMRPDAFHWVGEAVERDDVVAIFGAVSTDAQGTIAENVYPCGWGDVLEHGARGTLSMGCYVRGADAKEEPFNEAIDKGEDFEWYLRLLEYRAFVKLPRPLVTIRTKVPSAIGPRGYRSLDWRKACDRFVDEYR